MEPAPRKFTAANPLSSAPSIDRFRQIWLDILLNLSIDGAAISNFRCREFPRRRLPPPDSTGATLATLRRATYFLVLVLLVLVAVLLAYSNPEPVTLDIGITRIENVSMSVALAGAFAVGWLFGLISAGAALLRMMGDRRRLRRDIRFAEAELSSLRGLPLQDAD